MNISRVEIKQASAGRPAWDYAYCTDVRKFLALLHECREENNEGNDGAMWVFRGHWDASWRLQSSARREHLDRKWIELLEHFGADRQQMIAPIHRRSLQDVWPSAEGAAFWTRKAHHDHPEKTNLFPYVPNKLADPRPRMQDLGWLSDREQARRFYQIQCAAEFEAVREFADLADEIGFPVLEERKDIPTSRAALIASDGFPPPCRTAALAQHHGVPTRLLDWTRRPLVAALFATDEPDEWEPSASQDSDYLCVWALNVEKAAPERVPHSREPSIIRRMHCAHYLHEYLHAQDGVFTWFDDEAELDWLIKNNTWASLVDHLESQYPRSLTEPHKVLRRYLLPRAMVAELRRHLRTAYSVTRAHIMPTYDSVGETVTLGWRRSVEVLHGKSVREVSMR